MLGTRYGVGKVPGIWCLLWCTMAFGKYTALGSYERVYVYYAHIYLIMRLIRLNNYFDDKSIIIIILKV